MGEDAQRGELDLAAVFGRVARRWPLALGMALAGATLGLGITAALTPEYEAKATLIFPNVTPSFGLQSLGLQNAAGSENMELVEGIITSREVEDGLVQSTGLKRRDLRENLRVSQIPGRRLVTISYVSPDKSQGLKVVTESLNRLNHVQESIGVNTSKKRLTGYREAYDEKVRTVREIERQIEEFQRRAATVPTSEDGFTGSDYLKQQQEALLKLQVATRKVEAKRAAAQRVGAAAVGGLPTGLERETKWRDELLKASIELDQMRAKYQPGTAQVKEAEEKLATTKSNLTKEIAQYVKSVESGADLETAELMADQVVAKWEYARAQELARVAPQEAAEYRGLIGRLQQESKARDELKTEADAEAVRNKVEAKIWQVLDEPYVEEEAVNKKFGMNAGLGLVLGGLLGALAANRAAKK